LASYVRRSWRSTGEPPAWRSGTHQHRFLLLPARPCIVTNPATASADHLRFAPDTIAEHLIDYPPWPSLVSLRYHPPAPSKGFVSRLARLYYYPPYFPAHYHHNYDHGLQLAINRSQTSGQRILHPLVGCCARITSRISLHRERAIARKSYFAPLAF
jgi:hypothetical protein